MGTNSNIEFSPGTLYIKHRDNNWQEFAKVEDATFEYHTADTDTVYMRKIADDAEFTFTIELSIWQRIKLFGFWATIKSLFRRMK